MVRRALSLRRGSTLGLEIDTGSTPFTRSISFTNGDIPPCQNEVGGIGAASGLTRRGSRRDPSTSSLPLSRHHQSMRRRSSAVGGASSTIASIMGGTCRNGNRARTDSNSTSISTSSVESASSASSLSTSREVTTRDMTTNSSRYGPEGDNELAVILDDDVDNTGNIPNNEP